MGIPKNGQPPYPETDTNKIKNQSKESTPPTFEEVKDYCLERNYSISPEKFFNHFEGLGWKYKGSSIFNWKRFADNWEITEYTKKEKPSRCDSTENSNPKKNYICDEYGNKIKEDFFE